MLTRRCYQHFWGFSNVTASCPLSLHHHFTLHISTEVYGSRILSSLYIYIINFWYYRTFYLIKRFTEISTYTCVDTEFIKGIEVNIKVRKQVHNAITISPTIA